MCVSGPGSSPFVATVTCGLVRRSGRRCLIEEDARAHEEVAAVSRDLARPAAV